MSNGLDVNAITTEKLESIQDSHAIHKAAGKKRIADAVKQAQKGPGKLPDPSVFGIGSEPMFPARDPGTDKMLKKLQRPVTKTQAKAFSKLSAVEEQGGSAALEKKRLKLLRMCKLYHRHLPQYAPKKPPRDDAGAPELQAYLDDVHLETSTQQLLPQADQVLMGLFNLVPYVVHDLGGMLPSSMSSYHISHIPDVPMSRFLARRTAHRFR